MKSLVATALLIAGVAIEVLAVLGIVLMRDPFDRRITSGLRVSARCSWAPRSSFASRSR